VLLFDQIGFGTRIEEGSRFYERYPHWSKMGKMVADTIAAVDMLRNLDMADANRIYAGGWSLGGTVAILATALDERIGGVLSISGVTPWRQCSPDTEGLRTYSHLHGLMPLLGFFLGSESRIPCDFAEILACIAPRPALIVAPQYDRFAPPQVVAACVEQATAAYEMAGKAENMALLQTADYAIFSEEIRKKSVDWSNHNLR
jgi:dienelactone hydrolase